MVSIVFCKYSVANIEIKIHFINICHDYFILFGTEIMVEISVVSLESECVSSAQSMKALSHIGWLAVEPIAKSTFQVKHEWMTL